jgi:hypothetical protein
LALFGSEEKLAAFEIRPGLLVRHPHQEPWNNPWNFSRDQLIPYLAGCWRQKDHQRVRRLFLSHLKRAFLCQNFERDSPGTKKYPYRHRFLNDHGKKETRMFDGPDILAPNDLWHFILCGRLWYLYWLAPVGFIFLALAIFGHALFNRSDDEGQILAEACVAGPLFLWLYKTLKPDWKESLSRYWVERRNMTEMKERIIKAIG